MDFMLVFTSILPVLCLSSLASCLYCAWMVNSSLYSMTWLGVPGLEAGSAAAEPAHLTHDHVAHVDLAYPVSRVVLDGLLFRACHQHFLYKNQSWACVIFFLSVRCHRGDFLTFFTRYRRFASSVVF